MSARSRVIDQLIEQEAISPATAATGLPWGPVQELCRDGVVKCSYVHNRAARSNVMRYWLADPTMIYRRPAPQACQSSTGG